MPAPLGLSRPASIRTPERRQRFLETIARGASVTLACRVADMSRDAAYNWRKDDPSFATEWDDAYESGTDHFEDVLLRLATEGNLIATIFALKSRRPHVYNRRMLLPDNSSDDMALAAQVENQPKRRIYIPENHRDDATDDE